MRLVWRAYVTSWDRRWVHGAIGLKHKGPWAETSQAQLRLLNSCFLRMRRLTCSSDNCRVLVTGVVTEGCGSWKFLSVLNGNWTVARSVWAIEFCLSVHVGWSQIVLRPCSELSWVWACKANGITVPCQWAVECPALEVFYSPLEYVFTLEVFTPFSSVLIAMEACSTWIACSFHALWDFEAILLTIKVTAVSDNVYSLNKSTWFVLA